LKAGADGTAQCRAGKQLSCQSHEYAVRLERAAYFVG